MPASFELSSQGNYDGGEQWEAGNYSGGIPFYDKNIADAELTLQLISDYQTTNQAGAILLTYRGRVIQDLPTEDASRSANLPVGPPACFGTCCVKGESLIELPSLDKWYLPEPER